MDDIRKQDLKLFLRELVDPWRLAATVAALVVIFVATDGAAKFGSFFLASSTVLITVTGIAWSAAERRRFYSKDMENLWKGCRERLTRLDEVLKKLRKDQIADLREMPQTIGRVGKTLYLALRRADIISHEVQASEKDFINQSPTWQSNSNDPQSRELYRLADRNIAEYRAQYVGVMAGVQRTKAQSAYFMTTLDTLRMKVIGYRLVGRSPELQSQDFLEALAEARLQLQSIDTALEELDLGHYPKMIAAVQPPPIPEEIQEQLRQNR